MYFVDNQIADDDLITIFDELVKVSDITKFFGLVIIVLALLWNFRKIIRILNRS
jgi:hypothetical protein